MPTKATPIATALDVAHKLGVNRNDAREIIGVYRDDMADKLKKEGRVVVHGIGTLELKRRKQKMPGLNGKKSAIRAFNIGSFRIAPNLK